MTPIQDDTQEIDYCQEFQGYRTKAAAYWEVQAVVGCTQPLNRSQPGETMALSTTR